MLKLLFRTKSLTGQPRISFSMARDGLLPASFARVHPRFRTPHVTTILTGVVVAFCAMFTSIDEMADLTNIGTLFAFVLVRIGFLILRKRDPHRPRGFRTPWVPAVPLLGVASCVSLMFFLPWVTVRLKADPTTDGLPKGRHYRIGSVRLQPDLGSL